jgi:type I restriction enzyme R subunit
MLGRATRLCPEIKKKYFKIFDCVNVFEGISDFIDMKPVVKNPSFNFVDLYNIFNENDDYELQKNVLDRFSSKLKKIDSKKNTLIVDILNKIESNNTSQIKKIFSDKNIFINLDKFNLKNELTPISHHQDKVISAIEDYGNNTNYEDYLIEFVEFIKRNKNKVAALKIASQNPERISRSQLYDIVKFLDENNFSEAKLSSAYNKKTNTEIISNIIGFIRQASIGESLVSHNERVNKALENILSSKTWSETQVIWLKRLAHTLKNDFVSDKSTFDQGAFIDQGGFNRINKLFNNNLENIIDDFKVRIWK